MKILPPGCKTWLEGLKEKIRTAQIKAVLSVNRELIKLYWQVGKGIVHQQEREGWGRSVIEQVAKDIQKSFPGVEGFSSRNLWRMRSFYIAYKKENIENQIEA